MFKCEFDSLMARKRPSKADFESIAVAMKELRIK